MQLVQQGAVRFAIEGADKNHIYIRNIGTSPITVLNFYVEGNLIPYAGPASLGPGAVGTYNLDDGQLAQYPDPASLKVSGGSYQDQTAVSFYNKYAVAYWKFNEGSGSVASDSSTSGNNGAITGATWTAGRYSNGLNFAAASQYVEKDLPDFTTSSLTVEFWIKPSVVSSGWRDMVC